MILFVMKNCKLLAFILLAVLIVRCGDSKKLFSIDNSSLKPEYNLGETLNLKIKNTQNESIDSVLYLLNDKKLGSIKTNLKFSMPLKDQKLGIQFLIAKVHFNGKIEIDSTQIEITSNVKPKALNYTLVNTFAHDTTSFTEGFEFYNDTLYESTGQEGNSYFRKYDYKSGKIFKQINLDKLYFGEGISFLNGKLYQLTWENKEGFIYDAKTLIKEKNFTYDTKIKQGWGLTNDGKNLLQSDGTEKIWTLNPDDLSVIDFISVYTGSTKIEQLNEVEYVNGKLFANIWHKNAIAVINPKNGAVEGILDVAKLVKLVKNTTEERVLNGIAYNPTTKTFFIVGKNWNKMFEIKIEGF